MHGPGRTLQASEQMSSHQKEHMELMPDSPQVLRYLLVGGLVTVADMMVYSFLTGHPRRTWLTVSPPNGGRPVSTLNIRLPNENTSDAAVSGLPRTCSGEA